MSKQAQTKPTTKSDDSPPAKKGEAPRPDDEVKPPLSGVEAQSDTERTLSSSKPSKPEKNTSTKKSDKAAGSKTGKGNVYQKKRNTWQGVNGTHDVKATFQVRANLDVTDLVMGRKVFQRFGIYQLMAQAVPIFFRYELWRVKELHIQGNQSSNWLKATGSLIIALLNDPVRTYDPSAPRNKGRQCDMKMTRLNENSKYDANVRDVWFYVKGVADQERFSNPGYLYIHTRGLGTNPQNNYRLTVTASVEFARTSIIRNQIKMSTYTLKMPTLRAVEPKIRVDGNSYFLQFTGVYANLDDTPPPQAPFSISMLSGAATIRFTIEIAGRDIPISESVRVLRQRDAATGTDRLIWIAMPSLNSYIISNTNLPVVKDLDLAELFPLRQTTRIPTPTLEFS